MKKTAAFAAVLLLAASLGFSGTLTFKLSGGLTTFFANELGTGLQGQSDYLAKAFGATSAFAMPKSGASYAGEIAYFPFTHFGISVGYGYTKIEKTSTVAYSVGQVAVSETITPNIVVKPLTFNLHWLIFVTNWLHLDVAAGVGSYNTTLKWAYANENKLGSFDGSEEYAFQYQKSVLGFQGGLGLEFLVSSHISVVLNGWARKLKLDPITAGTWTDQSKDIYGSTSGSGSDHGLWAYDYTADGVKYAQLAFQAAAPGGMQGVSNVRNPRIDLSGLTATLGLKIGFNL